MPSRGTEEATPGGENNKMNPTAASKDARTSEAELTGAKGERKRKKKKEGGNEREKKKKT